MTKQRILSGLYAIDKDIHPNAHNLIKQMLHCNPKERIIMDQIKSHPWLTDTSPDAILTPLPVHDKSFLSQVSLQDSIDEVISVGMFSHQRSLLLFSITLFEYLLISSLTYTHFFGTISHTIFLFPTPVPQNRVSQQNQTLPIANFILTN